MALSSQQSVNTLYKENKRDFSMTFNWKKVTIWLRKFWYIPQQNAYSLFLISLLQARKPVRQVLEWVSKAWRWQSWAGTPIQPQIWSSRLGPGTPKCSSFISDLLSELLQMLPCYAGEQKHDVSLSLLQENESCYVRALRKQSPATKRKKGRWEIHR